MAKINEQIADDLQITEKAIEQGRVEPLEGFIADEDVGKEPVPEPVPEVVGSDLPPITGDMHFIMPPDAFEEPKVDAEPAAPGGGQELPTQPASAEESLKAMFGDKKAK